MRTFITSSFFLCQNLGAVIRGSTCAQSNVLDSALSTPSHSCPPTGSCLQIVQTVMRLGHPLGDDVVQHRSPLYKDLIEEKRRRYRNPTRRKEGRRGRERKSQVDCSGACANLNVKENVRMNKNAC